MRGRTRLILSAKSDLDGKAFDAIDPGCVIAALWSFSFGLGTQATSHWLKLESASDTLVGLVHAAYYLGVAGTSMACPG